MMVRKNKVRDADWFADIDLVHCSICGHMFNRAFGRALASRLYGDVQLTNVPVHPSMVDRLRFILSWLGDDIVQDRKVLEIGGGSGHMARILSRFASSVLIYEPCIQLTPDMLPEANIRLITGTFPQAKQESVDVVFCRQVIEHVADPFTMLQDIRRVLPIGGHAYLEVPDAAYIATHAAIPDIHLLHVQYFSRANFCALAARAGFYAVRTLDIYGGHDFGVLFRAVEQRSHPNFSGIDASGLVDRLKGRMAIARRRILAMPGPLALYGATPHTQVFINALGMAANFEVTLDDNPRNDGWALYDSERIIPVRETKTVALDRYGTVIIGAYLHDEVIAQRLRDAEYTGPIYTIRPAPITDGDSLPASIWVL